MTFAARPNYAKPPAPAEEAVFWDAALQYGTWIYSESNQRALAPVPTSGGNTWSVYASPNRTSGKRYYEILCRYTTLGGSFDFQDVGISSETYDRTIAFIYNGAACARMLGRFLNSGNFGAGSFTTTQPITIMVAVEFATEKVYIGINGSWLSANPVAGTGFLYPGGGGAVSGGPQNPVASVQDNLRLDVTILGNTSNIIYTPPSGFVVWGAP